MVHKIPISLWRHEINLYYDLREKWIFQPQTNKELKDAVILWCVDKKKAIKDYGYIGRWDTSKITNMSGLFSDFPDEYTTDNYFPYRHPHVTVKEHLKLLNTHKSLKVENDNWIEIINQYNKRESKYTHPDLFPTLSDYTREISTYYYDYVQVQNMNKTVGLDYNQWIVNYFNEDISNWDVSNVTDMSYMFASCPVFNSDISGWDTSKVTDMRYMFREACMFNQDIGGWNTCNVTNMDWMFCDADLFRQDISN